MSDTFICSVCKKTYNKELTDIEAEKQLEKEFPGFKKDECDIVCDDCYKKMGFE